MANKIYEFFKNSFINIIIVILIIIIVLLKIELPYTIFMEGGTTNLSSVIKVEDEGVNTGKYKSLYVMTIKANVITYLIAKINSKWDLIENKEYSLNEKETYDDINNRDILFLKKSINNAIKTAYIKANKKYEVTKNNIYVVGSECDLKIGEQIIQIDDVIINDTSDIRKILEEKNIDDELNIVVKYKNETKTKKIKIKESDNKKVLGVYLLNIEDINVEPNIKVNFDKNESGSSAGLMISLIIYDKLTDFDLSNGLKIVGTGTIEEDGSVGKIDGLKYKMLGLSKEKYDVFFIPYENIEEAEEINQKYKLNMKYIPVKTFDDAVNYLLSVKK